MRPNWFLAFPFDGRFLLELPAPPTGCRRFHPDDVHLTLAFLGPCGEASAEQALKALDACLAALTPSPIEVSLGPVVPLGSPRRYSALSALLERGRAETAAIIGALRDPVCLAASSRPDNRPPKPHITLARPERQANDAQRQRAVDWAESLELGHVQGRLDRIALYTWRQDRQKQLFSRVAERHFQKSTGPMSI
jgi:2'-5' RNA ligase